MYLRLFGEAGGGVGEGPELHGAGDQTAGKLVHQHHAVCALLDVAHFLYQRLRKREVAVQSQVQVSVHVQE